MVTARDLDRNADGKVIVGEETRRVCWAAVKRFHPFLSDTKIVATAGYSEDFQIVMGAGPMHEYLLRSCGVPPKQICTPDAETFNTNGEMKELVRYMREVLKKSPEDTYEIHLVASWWHLPRARMLLHARLEPWMRWPITKVRWVPARSYPLMSWKLWYSIAGEVLGAWPKNIRNKNVFWWRHQLYSCRNDTCKGDRCVERANGVDTCHRCGQVKTFTPRT